MFETNPPSDQSSDNANLHSKRDPDAKRFGTPWYELSNAKLDKAESQLGKALATEIERLHELFVQFESPNSRRNELFRSGERK